MSEKTVVGQPVEFPDRAARFVSDFLSPPSVFAMLGFVVGWVGAGAFWPGLIWGVIYGFFVSLAPLLVVIYLLKTGRISDLHIRERRQRNLPYLTSVSGAVAVCALAVYLDGPLLMVALAAGTLFGLSLLTIINLFWLISSHMSGITMAVVFVGTSFGWLWGLLFTPLVIMVFYSRLRLRRHNVAQLVAGGLAGVITILFVVVLGLS